jgi:hypothetical protein
VYEEKMLTPMSLWEHRNGGLYIVFGVAECSTNGPREHAERSVVYWSATYQGLRYRELSEFLDGRFTPLPVVKP